MHRMQTTNCINFQGSIQKNLVPESGAVTVDSVSCSCELRSCLQVWAVIMKPLLASENPEGTVYRSRGLSLL